MAEPTSQPARKPRRRLVAVTVIVALIAVLLVGVGIYGFLDGPGSTTTTPPNAAASHAARVTGPAAATASPAPIPEAADPEVFARRVARAVFTWDTTTGYGPSDYIQAVIDVGDPSGNETPGLAADLADYLPTRTAWAQLRQYETRQWLSIDTATVPTAWAQALQQGRATLLPGTTAYTITGTRHRAGVWNGTPVTTTEHVSFTIFETCQPTYLSCRLLRLSQLDNPLR